MSTANPTTPANHPTDLRVTLPLPARYDGTDKRKCRGFLLQVRNYLAVNPQYSAEEQKVGFLVALWRAKHYKK